MIRHTVLALAALAIPFAAAGCDEGSQKILDPEPSSGPEPAPSAARTPPRADAGPDLTFIDMDEDGIESVVLNGCGCTAGSSPIARYEWQADSITFEGTPGDDGCSLALDLEIGRYVIMLTVTDEDGLTAKDLLAVDVRSRYPEVWIQAPGGYSAFATGSDVRFSAKALDWRGESITDDRLVWESDLAGELGTGATIMRSDLARGDHLITLTATDIDGYASTATTGLRIVDGPTVTILSPADGSSFAVLDDVYYEGQCIDGQGSPVTGNGVYWDPRPCMADIHDMYCGVSYYVPGSDTTTLRCTDENGLVAEATVMIDIYVSYERNIEPYPLGFGCTECHGVTAQEGDVRLDTYLALTTGGNSNGPLIVAGNSAQGILIPKLLTGHYDPSPEALMTAIPWVWMQLEMIEFWWTTDLLGKWIEDGAPDN